MTDPTPAVAEWPSIAEMRRIVALAAENHVFDGPYPQVAFPLGMFTGMLDAWEQAESAVAKLAEIEALEPWDEDGCGQPVIYYADVLAIIRRQA